MSEQLANSIKESTLPTVVAHLVSYNNESTLAGSIRSVLAQVDYQLGVNLHLYVTDNNSSDSSAFIASEFARDGVTVERQDTNLGFTGAHNKALQLIGKHNADYLLLLNPDLALEPDCILRLVQTLERDRSAGSATPKLLRANPDLRPCTPATIDAVGMEFHRSCRHFDRGAEEIDQGQYDSEEYVFGGTGACLLLRADTIADVAFPASDAETPLLFEPHFFAYREDAELAWRLQRFAWTCRYQPRAVGYHVRRVTPQRRATLSDTINRLGVQNRFLLQMLHYDARYLELHLPTLLRNLIVIAACLCIEQRSLQGIVDAFRFSPSLWKKRRWLKSRERVPAAFLREWFSTKCSSMPTVAVLRNECEEAKITTVDVIIVNYNSAQRLRLCLQSLITTSRELADAIQVNIRVVDNASSDDSARRIAPLFSSQPMIHFDFAEDNLGFAGAINRAAAQCSGDALLILNPDTEVSAAALRALVAALEQYPELDATAPILVDQDGTPQKEFSAKRLPRLSATVAELVLLGRLWPNNPLSKPSRIHEHPLVSQFFQRGEQKNPYFRARPRHSIELPLVIEQPPAACFLVRRSCFSTLQGFDTDFWPAWFEDVDFCKRMKLQGMKAALVANSIVTHEGGYSTDTIDPTSFRSIWFSNQARYWKKHGSLLDYTIVRSLIPVGIFLRAIWLSAQPNARSESKELFRLAAQFALGRR